MKKLFAVSAVCLLMSSGMAMAGSHTMAGCGLGYVLFGSKDNSQVMQILAATTNGTSGNQTFGITSGTLGCTENGHVALNKQAEVYTEVNLRQLYHDIALGNGETLSGFSRIIGVKDAQRDSFNRLMKGNFSALTASSSSLDFLARIDQIVASHPELLS